MTTDATAASLRTEIAAARDALIAVYREHPDRQWHAYELKDAARNGWSDGAMSIAFSRLLDDGVFEVVEGDYVRLSG